MAKPVQTHIFCLDDHRSFSEDVKKRFSDKSRYVVQVSHNSDEFLKSIVSDKALKICKVAIIGVSDSKEHYDLAERLIGEIKKIDISTGIIILTSVEKIEEVRKTIRINVDAYIPGNSNSILRIHNTVKKMISEHGLLIYRKRRTVSIYALIAFSVLAAIFALIARLRLPLYF